MSNPINSRSSGVLPIIAAKIMALISGAVSFTAKPVSANLSGKIRRILLILRSKHSDRSDSMRIVTDPEVLLKHGDEHRHAVAWQLWLQPNGGVSPFAKILLRFAAVFAPCISTLSKRCKILDPVPAISFNKNCCCASFTLRVSLRYICAAPLSMDTPKRRGKTQRNTPNLSSLGVLGVLAVQIDPTLPGLLMI